MSEFCPGSKHTVVLHYAPEGAAVNPLTHPAEMQQQGNDLWAAWWSCRKVALRKCLIIPSVLVTWCYLTTATRAASAGVNPARAMSVLINSE